MSSDVPDQKILDYENSKMGLDHLDGPGECEPFYQQMKNESLIEDELPKVDVEEAKKEDVPATAKNDVVMQVEEEKRPQKQAPVPVDSVKIIAEQHP